MKYLLEKLTIVRNAFIWGIVKAPLDVLNFYIIFKFLQYYGFILT